MMEQIPDYIKLQAIYSHLEQDDIETKEDYIPDSMRWRKLVDMTNKGYLGKYPSYFFDDSTQNDEYLANVMNIIKLNNPVEPSGGKSMGAILGLGHENDEDPGGYRVNGKVRTSNQWDGNGEPTFDMKDFRLPKGWNTTGVDILKVSDDHKEIRTELIENNFFNIYPRSSNKGGVVTVALDHSPSMYLGIFYFEVTIVEGTGSEIDFALGFIREEKKTPSNLVITGLDLRSPDDRIISWSGKTGMMTVWNGKRVDKKYCTFGKGDTIGLGYNLVKDEFFITKNGNYVGELGSVNSFISQGFGGKKNARGLIPCACFGSWTGGRLNLGYDDKELFEFDIEHYVKSNKKNVMKEIQGNNIASFNVEKRFIDRIIIGHLAHNGYADTVEGLVKDISNGNGENVREFIGDTFDLCKLKKRVKVAMRKDAYEEIEQLLTTYYPNFFDDNMKIQFRLEVVKLLHLLDNSEITIKEGVDYATRLKAKFTDEESQYYVDHISVVFSYNKIRDCPIFEDIFDLNKTKIVYAITLALNKINHLPLVSPLDMMILRTDQALDAYMSGHGEDKSVLLINLLEDYIRN